MKLILLFVFLFSTHVSAKNNENWQGTYFPHGCIDCENNYVYIVLLLKVLENARNGQKMKNEADKASCGQFRPQIWIFTTSTKAVFYPLVSV